MSPSGTSIHLPEIRLRWGNTGDVHRVLLYDRQKIGTATVHYYSFSLAGPRGNFEQFVLAIRAKLGLTPPNGCWPVRFVVVPTTKVYSEHYFYVSLSHVILLNADNRDVQSIEKEILVFWFDKKTLFLANSTERRPLNLVLVAS